MPQLKLTKGNIDRVAKPGQSKTDMLYFDTEPKGFGLRVSPMGKATFIVQGRVGGTGKEARITIGPYGVFSVDQARDVAREHLRNMRLGLDPRDLKRQDEAMNVTLETVMLSYISRPGKLKESSKAELKRHVQKSLGAWANRPIVSITEEEVRRRHRELVEKGLDGKRGAPASANAAFVSLRILCNFAARQYRRADGSPLIQHNPVAVLKDHWAKLGKRTDRYIDRRKIGEVWNRLHAMRDEVVGYEALAAVDLTIFAILVGARRDEMATLTWDRVNIDDDDPTNCWWHLDDRKRGDPIWLPLSSQAVALLKLRPRLRLADGKDSQFVFPSWGKHGRIMDARRPMEEVSKIAGKHLSLHDMRRSFTNYAMRECLIEKFRVDLLTGHQPAQEDVTARAYLDLARLDWLQPEVQKIGDWIEHQAAVAGAKNVVQLAA